MNLLLCFRGNLQILQQRFHHSLGRLQGLLEEILLGTDWRIWIRSHRSRMVIRMNYFLHYKLILSNVLYTKYTILSLSYSLNYEIFKRFTNFISGSSGQPRLRTTARRNGITCSSCKTESFRRTFVNEKLSANFNWFTLKSFEFALLIFANLTFSKRNKFKINVLTTC